MPNIYKMKVIFPMGKVSSENLQLQSAVGKWDSCEKLSNISKETLVLTGSQDITSPPAKSIVLAESIPGAWLVERAWFNVSVS